MIIGGQFRHTKNPDGTVTIHDVPIFSTCRRGKYHYDRGWLEDALRHAREAEQDGHLPPLHVYHHGTPGKDPIPCGAFRIKSVEIRPFKGRMVPMHVADLVVNSAAVFEAIKGKRLLYRSVESDYAGRKIISLALLDSEAPFFDLPMLTVQGCTNEPQRGEDGREPALAFRASGDTTRVLMEFNMADTETVASIDHQGATYNLPWSQIAPIVAANEKAQKFEAEKDEAGDDEKMMEGEGATVDAAACVKAIEDGSISLADFEAIKAAMASREGAEAETEEAPAVEDEAPAEAMSKGDASKFAAIEAKNTALESRLNAMEQESALNAALDEGEAGLANRVVGVDVRGKLETFARAHGIEAMQTYAAELRDQLPPIEDDAEEFSADSLPSEVQKFRAEDPDRFAEAKAEAALWKTCRDAGTTSVTLARWLELKVGYSHDFSAASN